MECFGPNKTTFREMASNKHFDLKKIENFVRSKYCHEDIAKDKGKKLISENLVIISTA